MENTNPTNFFKYVFEWNEDTKSDTLNIIQYFILAIIPIIILNKMISKYIPGVNEEKGSLEITFEIILQSIILFLGLFLIHRIVCYFPTFSGVDYPEVKVIPIILISLVFLLGLETRLGQKVNILVERLTHFWNGTTPKNTNKENTNKNTNMNTNMNTNVNTMNMALDATPISSLPPQQPQTQQQPLPDYNKMYQNTTTPLVNANSPTDSYETYQEPMAANSLLPGNW